MTIVLGGGGAWDYDQEKFSLEVLKFPSNEIHGTSNHALRVLPSKRLARPEQYHLVLRERIAATTIHLSA